MAKVGDLQALHEKYHARGFRLVAIADEELSHEDQVKQEMAERGATFPIGIDDKQTTVRRYASRGSLSLPRFYLVDGEGTVVSSRIPTEKELEALLETVYEPALGRTLHEKLATARAAYERDAAGVAYEAAQAFVEADDEALAEDAAFLRTKIERYAAWHREQIEKALADERVSDAMGELLLFQVRFGGMDAVTWADEQVGALVKHEALHAERFAWKKLRAAMAKEAKGVEKRSALKSVRYAYEQVVKRHAGSAPAAVARARLAALPQP